MFKETFLVVLISSKCILIGHYTKLTAEAITVQVIFATFYQYKTKFIDKLSNLKTSKQNRSQTEDYLWITLHQIEPK